MNEVVSSLTSLLRLNFMKNATMLFTQLHRGENKFPVSGREQFRGPHEAESAGPGLEMSIFFFFFLYFVL